MPLCHAFNSPQEKEENVFWDHSVVDTFDDVTLKNLIKTLMSPPDIVLNVIHGSISDHSAFLNAL
jgi:hypothetical protein